ncbi:MAG: response regulator [Bacteroidetes bacterium]|nr:response regulator [Bacteroidota bacterium]
MKAILRNLLILAFFLNGVFYCHFCFAQNISTPKANNGILDLREYNLYGEPVSLKGEWLFYWNQMLFPGDSAMNVRKINFPSLWNEYSLDGKKISAQGYATYSLKIILPKTRPQLALELPDVYAAYALYVNGTLLAKNGQTGKSAREASPFWTTSTIYLPQEPDTISLLLQVSNFWHSKGGTYKEILLGKQEVLYLKRERDTAYDLILTGCLFMGGLFFLGLYFFGKKDKTIFYFSLFCIVYSYRMIGTDLYVLHTLFPGLNWFLTIHLEYLSLSLGVALFAQYTRYLYPDDANPLIMRIMVSFCVLFAAIAIFTPPIVFTSLINVFLGAMFICLAYAFYVNIEAARNKRSGSIYALLSTGVVLLIFLLINLDYFHILPLSKGIVFVGYIGFFFLQSLALSHRFAFTFKQAALQAQQGLKVKSEFLSTMSHEIRTPLNAVIGLTHLLLHKKPREDQKKDLDVLLFSANNLLSIVNNILDYNKIEEGKIHFEQIPMNPATIARNIVAGFKMSAEDKGIDLRLDIDGSLNQELIGDPTRMGQVINNLVHNAIKFTKEGWVCLSLKATNISDESIVINFRVEDTGIGIAPEKQQLIFERFTQADSSTSRSYGGTGLGLSISKKILELQGAELKLVSEQGKGSSFYFEQRFALSKEKIVAHNNSVSQQHTNDQRLKGVSILLVEDNPFNILVAQTILENSGAQIDVATNGEEALDTFNAEKHKLILMDLHMPVMDGFEATERLRGKGETIPIIALTANTPQEVEGEAYAAGLTDIIVKPFNPDNLHKVILQYIA